MKLAVARLWFCSNSFVPHRTQLADLRTSEWSNSPQALRNVRPGSEFDGLSQVLAEHGHWRPTLLRSAAAPPGGPLSKDAFGTWLADVESGLRRERFDGVYLSLHGACQAEGDPVADLTIMRRVRAAVGHIPVVASFDMHANLPLETTLLLDGATANRVWPHGGGADAATRALRMLAEIAGGGIRPVGALARVARRTPVPGLCASIGPVGEGVLDASVLWGFPWGDSPYASACAMVWADGDARLAQDAVMRLAQRIRDWRPAQPTRPPDAATANSLVHAEPKRPVALLDTADDPLAGGLADTPGLLRAFLLADHERAVFAALHDPETIAAASVAGLGNAIVRPLGARTTTAYGLPVEVRARVVRIVPAFDRDGGTIAVLRAGRTDIVVCTHRPRLIDASLLARAGIDLASVGVLAVKGGELARATLAGHFPTIIACDSPGPTSTDTARLPFKYSGVPHLPWSAAYAKPRDDFTPVPRPPAQGEARRA